MKNPIDKAPLNGEVIPHDFGEVADVIAEVLEGDHERKFKFFFHNDELIFEIESMHKDEAEHYVKVFNEEFTEFEFTALHDEDHGLIIKMIKKD